MHARRGMWTNLLTKEEHGAGRGYNGTEVFRRLRGKTANLGLCWSPFSIFGARGREWPHKARGSWMTLAEGSSADWGVRRISLHCSMMNLPSHICPPPLWDIEHLLFLVLKPKGDKMLTATYILDNELSNPDCSEHTTCPWSHSTLSPVPRDWENQGPFILIVFWEHTCHSTWPALLPYIAKSKQ